MAKIRMRSGRRAAVERGRGIYRVVLDKDDNVVEIGAGLQTYRTYPEDRYPLLWAEIRAAFAK